MKRAATLNVALIVRKPLGGTFCLRCAVSVAEWAPSWKDVLGIVVHLSKVWLCRKCPARMTTRAGKGIS